VGLFSEGNGMPSGYGARKVKSNNRAAANHGRYVSGRVSGPKQMSSTAVRFGLPLGGLVSLIGAFVHVSAHGMAIAVVGSSVLLVAGIVIGLLIWNTRDAARS